LNPLPFTKISNQLNHIINNKKEGRIKLINWKEDRNKNAGIN